MVDINWNIYKSKFKGKETGTFESLAYMLFCYEYNIKVGIFRFKNQVGIEAEPIEVNDTYIGFQAKYYDTKISANKEDIIDSLKKAKTKNPSLNKILIYTNQELSESKVQKSKKPKYQLDIDQAAQQLNIEIDWRLPGHIEKQLSVPENSYLAEYFFSSDNGIIEFLNKLKAHATNILFAIQTNISFKEQEIKIDRNNIILSLDTNKSKIIIIVGDGGSGKTALVKDFFETAIQPCYILKAAEFHKQSLGAIFNQFGKCDLDDFLESHEQEAKKVFIIDSAEKLAELENQDVFITFLSALIKSGWKIVFTTRNSYLDDLSFQMLEVYRLSFETIKINNLSEEELKGISETSQFKLPNNSRLQILIRNLFYLNEYLTNYDIVNDQTDFIKFKEILWQKKIQNAKYKKENIHIERERCFLNLAKQRCNSGNFFLEAGQCTDKILSFLEQDEIIKYNSLQNGYFITHDIYEEWALEKLIEREYLKIDSYPLFFNEIGNSLPIRRAFRSWLSDKIIQVSSAMKYFIETSFSESEVPIFWKDELLISVLLSEYSFSFLANFDTVLFENEKFYLKKIIFLLQIGCKQIDTTLQKIIHEQKKTSISPAHVFTKPKGKGWEAIIEFLYTKISAVDKEDLTFILPLLKDWISQYPKGKTARLAGLFALHFYNDCELNDSNYNSEAEKLLLHIVLASAAELEDELRIITEGLLNDAYNRHDTYNSLREAVLNSDQNTAYVFTLPEYVIKLADKCWYELPDQKHPYDFGGMGVEGYYFIREQWHYEYHPASALQTPVFYLLYAAFPQTIDFILDFTKRTVEAYFDSGLDASAHEIEVTIGSKKTKQIISASLWEMYRGTGSPVTPYLLQSIHMALEKRLLEFGKDGRKDVLKDWLNYLLKNTRSASITAVVTSVVLAYPDELFEVACILFGHYEFFKYDNLRAGSEVQAKRLYSIGLGLNKKFDEERIATCDDPHREFSLENIALQYQYFKSESVSVEEADERTQVIWKIIDHHYHMIPKRESESERYQKVRLLLARIDKRKMNPVFNQVEDKTIIEFNPAFEPDLEQYREEGRQEFENKFKYATLKLWGVSKFEERGQYGPYPQYDDNPELVLKRTKEILDNSNNLRLLKADIFNEEVPAYACAALIKLYSDKLSREDLLYCEEVITTYAVAPLQENYAYQISDGTEVAISALPFLYSIMPAKKSDYNQILLFILFDTYPIGEYKRICDYAIEAISKSLFQFSRNDANAILFGYLKLKPKLDLEYNRESFRNRKSRSEALREFFNKYKIDIDKISDTRESYDNLDFNSLEIHTAETAFQIIPIDSNNSIHLDFIKKVLQAFSSQILKKTSYKDSDDPKKVDYKLKHRFSEKFARFLLHREKSSIRNWTKPFIDSFTVTKEMAQFLSDVITAEDQLKEYDNFWTIWEAFYPTIKSASETNSQGYMDEIIRNYMLAWPWWNVNAKEWHSLRERETIFFKKICSEMGHHPTVLFSISKLLNDIGTPFLNEGIFWITDMLLNNQSLHETDMHATTIYYLEIIARKYVYLNRKNLKANKLLKDKMLVLLNFLVSKGSVSGYLLREDIL